MYSIKHVYCFCVGDNGVIPPFISLLINNLKKFYTTKNQKVKQKIKKIKKSQNSYVY